MVQRYLGAYGRFSGSRSTPVALLVAVSALGIGACSAGGDTAPQQGLPVGQTPAPNTPVTPTPGGTEPGTVTPGNPVQPSSPSGTGGTPPTPIEPGGFIGEGDPGSIIGDNPPAATSDGLLVTGEVCSSLEVGFQKVIPTVMLVLDRSTSMFKSSLPNGGYSGASFGSFEDRWEGLRAAVAGLEPYSKDVQFGAITYTGYQNGTCPELQGADIQVATDNFADILALLPPNTEAIPDQASETPTAESMQAALDALLAVPADGPKYLVLITDGLPDMCAGNPELINKGVWCSHDPAFAVAQDAFAQGVTTYVIGLLGNPSDANEAEAGEYFLNGIAHAGQGLDVEPYPEDNLHCIQQESTIARENPPANDFYQDWRTWAAATYGEDGYTYAEKLYFAPEDGDALGTQLGSVVATTRSCSFEMETSVVVAQANKGAVRLSLADGTNQDLVYGDPNGWALAADNDYTVVIQGTSCDQIKSDVVQNVKIQFPCEVRVPRIR